MVAVVVAADDEDTVEGGFSSTETSSDETEPNGIACLPRGMQELPWSEELADDVTFEWEEKRALEVELAW
ncbi:UNVERIFIED_CONTAM: hypothetical protein K2H54_039145 [Gekko kuhli]